MCVRLKSFVFCEMLNLTMLAQFTSSRKFDSLIVDLRKKGQLELTSVDIDPTLLGLGNCHAKYHYLCDEIVTGRVVTVEYCYGGHLATGSLAACVDMLCKELRKNYRPISHCRVL